MLLGGLCVIGEGWISSVEPPARSDCRGEEDIGPEERLTIWILRQSEE
jgi:hypothetical protein